MYLSPKSNANKSNLWNWNARTLQDNVSVLEQKTPFISPKLQKNSIDISALCKDHIIGSSQLAQIKVWYTLIGDGKSEKELYLLNIGFAKKNRRLQNPRFIFQKVYFPKGVLYQITRKTLRLDTNSSVVLVWLYLSPDSKANKFNLWNWNVWTLQDNVPILQQIRHLISLEQQKNNINISALCETHFVGSSQ